MYKSKNNQNVSTKSYNFKTLTKTEVNYGTTEMSLKFHPNFKSVNLASINLMFFWPCIMNWLYINYQLDALITIYS